jgi:hypothetical protein
MRRRAVIGALAMSAASLASVGWGPAAAQAGTSCTWGGSALAPTGTFVLTPGDTNTPATTPLAFSATGVLAGDAGCRGKLSFVGQFDIGSTCALGSFEGVAKGLPGVSRFWGKTALGTGMPPTLLYDGAGKVVAVESAQVLTAANAPQLTNCTAPGGFRGGTFSSVIELFA